MKNGMHPALTPIPEWPWFNWERGKIGLCRIATGVKRTLARLGNKGAGFEPQNQFITAGIIGSESSVFASTQRVGETSHAEMKRG